MGTLNCNVLLPTNKVWLTTTWLILMLSNLPRVQPTPQDSDSVRIDSDEIISTLADESETSRFPLRDAVERLPDRIIEKDRVPDYPFDERVPLRDAVEHRESGFFHGPTHEPIWLVPLKTPLIQAAQKTAVSKVVCNVDVSKMYNTEEFYSFFKILPYHQCTHLIYNAATLDPNELIAVSTNEEYDIVKGGYRMATGLRTRDPSLQVFISLAPSDGGVSFAEAMKKNPDGLFDSITSMLNENRFDGILIDWENYSKHLKLWKELIERLRGTGHGLAIVSRPTDTPDPKILSMLDVIVLRGWKSTDHPAPLKNTISDTEKWIERLDENHISKIVLDVPMFGYQITNLGVNREENIIPYSRVCEKLQGHLWISGRDDEGPYIKHANQWIGYEDPLSITAKMAFVRSSRLGGVSLFNLNFDDIQGICGEPWPMLNAARKALGLFDPEPIEKCATNGVFRDPDNCAGFFSCIKGELYHGDCGMYRFFDPEIGCVRNDKKLCQNGIDDKTKGSYIKAQGQDRFNDLDLSHEDRPRVVCYMTSWSIYRKGDGKFVPEALDHRLCTDVIYAFAGLNPETLLMQSFDSWADIENKLYERLTSIDGPRILLALGGWTDSSGNKYSRLISNENSRRKFIVTTINYLKRYNFDGLSIEWNYPKCWQSDCRKGPNTDKPNFTKFLQELKEEFVKQEPPLHLGVAISGYKEIIDNAYEIDDISQTADFLSVMSYDYHGGWESKTGHLAPLKPTTHDSNPFYNVNFALEYLIKLGAERSKLTVGIPFYGQTFHLTDPARSELGDPATGPGAPGNLTGQPGILAYSEICEKINRQHWQIGAGPSAHRGDQWVAFEDTKSVSDKGKYILKNGFGGAMVWTVDMDDFTNRCCWESFPLLKSLNRALGRLLTPAPTPGDCRRPPKPVTPPAPTMTTHSDAADNGPKPTRPMSTSTTKTTTWPTWTQQTEEHTTTRRPLSTTRSTTMSTTTKKSTTTMDNIVPVEGTPCEFGRYQPDPTNCANYYRCVLGGWKKEQCVSGLHWDRERTLCDWPSSVKCRSQTGSETTSIRPTTTTTNHVTKSCVPGHYYANPDSCTSFFMCVNGNLVLKECGPGLNWSDKKNMCDWAFKNPCQETTKKTAPYTLNDDNEICTEGTLSAVPGDCGSFHMCVHGHYVRQNCPKHTHFDRQAKTCDWEYLVKCEDDNSVNEITTMKPNWPVRPTTIKPTTMKPMTVKPTTTQATWQPSPTQSPTKPSSGEIDPNKKSPLSGYFKVVCYFTNWAWYRPGIGRYIPENIDHTLCTHVVYGFAVLDYSELIIKAHDSWADYDNHFYDRVVAYKKRGVKVLLALGGWNDSAGDKYSRLVGNPTARKKFINHVLEFLTKYKFDGLDLDWEYPVCWQVDCNKGPDSDKEGFAMLLKEIKTQFEPRGLLLSAAVSPSKKVIDKGYNVPVLAKYLDWIAVMTYDYHGQWDKKTGHVAPLYHHPQDDYYYFNANYTINYWISRGAPPRKIVMGMPMYGQSFTMNDPRSGSGLNAPGRAGNAGEFTRADGFLSYYEICDRILNRKWTVYQDPERRMGPFAFKGNQWVGFDDPDMIRQKAQYIRDMDLGGGMIWALDLDDFRGRCGQGPHPLMHTLQLVLSEPPTKHDKPIRPPNFGELDWEMEQDSKIQYSASSMKDEWRGPTYLPPYS